MQKTDTVLITGSSGFTGKHVIRALRLRGNIVIETSNEMDKHNGVDNFFAPLENAVAIQTVIKTVKPDYILHLGGVSFTSYNDSINYYKINVLGTENLLKSCLTEAPNIKKIILASSSAIYGDPKIDFISEVQRPNPISHYGCSKLSMEHIAKDYMKHLPILITRPFNYTGPGQSSLFLVPKMVKHFQRRESVIQLGNIAVTREFSDVRDIANNYIALLCQSETGIVNLGSGIEHSFQDILNTLVDITGHEIKLEINSEFVRSNDIMRVIGDTSKLKQLIDCNPQYTLHKTLTDMLDYASI